MKKLGDMGILNPETSHDAISMIKMRNIVVHQYEKINYELLYEGLEQLYKDFLQFEKEILSWLDTFLNNL